MRKLTLLLTLLLLCALPASAETPALDEALVGSWTPVLEIYNDYGSFHPFAPTESEPYIITADGQLTNPLPDFPPLPLLYNEATGQWYLQDPEDSAQIITLSTDRYGQLIMHSGEETCILRRENAAPAELPTAVPALATGGDWQARALYVFHSDYSDGFSCIMDFEALGLPTPEITLPAFVSHDAIAQAWHSTASQVGAGVVMPHLQDIYGYVLHSPDTLLLVSQHGLIVLERISVPAVDEAILPHAQQLANWWRLDALTVGGIPLSPDVYDVEDFPLAIDEQGFALLGDAVHQLQLEDDTLLLNGVPLRYDGSILSLQIADGLELRYITEGDWYRAQLNGTWRLSGVEIPVMEFWEDDAADAQLVITADDAVVLRHSAGELRFTLQRTNDVLTYYLVDATGNIQLLTIRDESLLAITNDTATYSLSFTPAE